MIDQLDVEGLGCLPELPGDLDIGGGGCRVAAGRVIVGRDDGGGISQDGRSEDFPGMALASLV